MEFNDKKGSTEKKDDKEVNQDKQNKEDIEKFPINLNVDFDEKNFIFYAPKSKISLETLYKSNSKQIKKK